MVTVKLTISRSFVGGKYRFDRKMLSDTSVSTMQVYCTQDSKDCILFSTTANKMLPVTFRTGNYFLGSCNVFGIYIIHDCLPRELPLVTAKLEQNVDGNYYLHVSLIFYSELVKVIIYFIKILATTACVVI